MSTAGLVLAASLALSPPEGEPDAFVITSDPVPTEPAPAPPAPPAPTVTVVPAPAAPGSEAWGPSSDAVAQPVAVTSVTVVEMEPLPPIPDTTPRRPSPGAGLLFGGTMAFAIGLGIQMREFGSAVDVCGYWAQRGFSSVNDCFAVVDSPGDYVPVGVAFGSSIVMTSIGSAALGQYDAWQTMYGDMRRRNRTSRMIGGAIMTGLGIAAFAAEGALLYADWQNPCGSYECHVQRRALWLGVADFGTIGIASGFGLLSWSAHHRKHLERYERLRWSVAPTATPGSMGGSMALRF